MESTLGSVPLQVVPFSLESVNHPLGFFQIRGQYGVVLLQVGYHGLQLLVMNGARSHFGGLVFYASVDVAFLTQTLLPSLPLFLDSLLLVVLPVRGASSSTSVADSKSSCVYE